MLYSVRTLTASKPRALATCRAEGTSDRRRLTGRRFVAASRQRRSVTVRGNRRLLTFAFFALALLVTAAPAQAGRKWCQRDPVLSVSGTLVNVFVSVYDDQQIRV